ncbi:hypothetical protein D3C78_1369400 [compost metagenome]
MLAIERRDSPKSTMRMSSLPWSGVSTIRAVARLVPDTAPLGSATTLCSSLHSPPRCSRYSRKRCSWPRENSTPGGSRETTFFVVRFTSSCTAQVSLRANRSRASPLLESHWASRESSTGMPNGGQANTHAARVKGRPSRSRSTSVSSRGVLVLPNSMANRSGSVESTCPIMGADLTRQPRRKARTIKVPHRSNGTHKS